MRERLASEGFYEVAHTPGLWKHISRPIQFSLVVDDFGVKYVDKKDAEHLIAALKDSYEISVDWEGTLYCGLTLDWNYDERWVDVSMPAYIPAMLHKFRHHKPRRRQDAPHAWDKPLYGASVQFAENDDDSTPLSPAQINRLQ